MPKAIAVWILCCIACNSLATSASEALVSAYWESDDSTYTQTKNQLISAAGGDVFKLYQWLKRGPGYRTDAPRGILEQQRIADDGARFPYIVVVPETYNAQRPIAVEFMLHGAVNRPRWGAGGKWWNKGKKYEAYLQRDQITVFPAAWRNAVWWSDAQADNLSSILRRLKSIYNIDDNRVYLSGVSDGGTGAYFFAFKQPSEWAAFLPYIGHMGVLTLKSEQQTGRIDIENLVNSALFIVNGENDPVYPAKSVDPFIHILEKAKINHTFTLIKKGKHDMKWFDAEQSNISVFKEQHLRDPLPEKARWITDRVDRYARIHWLKIDELSNSKTPGWISARRNGNAFTVLTQDVSRFTLLLNPDMIDFNQPVAVTLNGKPVFNGLVAQDAEILFRWASNRDRAQLFTTELTLELAK